MRADQFNDDFVFDELPDEESDEARYKDSILETPLTPDALQKRVLRLFKDAKTAERSEGSTFCSWRWGF